MTAASFTPRNSHLFADGPRLGKQFDRLARSEFVHNALLAFVDPFDDGELHSFKEAPRKVCADIDRCAAGRYS